MMVQKRMRANHYQQEELLESSPLRHHLDKRICLHHEMMFGNHNQNQNQNLSSSEVKHNNIHRRVQNSLHNLRISLQSQIQVEIQLQASSQDMDVHMNIPDTTSSPALISDSELEADADANLMNYQHENLIARLLEEDQYLEAYHRCFTHPHECVPIPMQVVLRSPPEANHHKNTGSSADHQDQENPNNANANTNAHVLFRNTPLGIACRKFNPKHDADTYIHLNTPPRTLTSPCGKFSSAKKDKRNAIRNLSPNNNNIHMDRYYRDTIHCSDTSDSDSNSVTMCTPPRYSYNQRPNQRYDVCGSGSHQQYQGHGHAHDNLRLKGTGVTQMQLIRALYMACPQQIRCSQMKMGRTPLLDAITNPNSTSELRQFIMDADCDFEYHSQLQMQLYMHHHIVQHEHDMAADTDVQMRPIHCRDDVGFLVEPSGQLFPPSMTLGLPGTRPALSTPDSNGLLPLHHLINQVRRNAIIAPENKSALESIQYMIHICPELVAANVSTPHCTSSSQSPSLANSATASSTGSRGVEVSPLIHLLSQKVGTKHQSFMKPVVECAEILLEANSYLVHTKSVMSKCTPLHMALRNGYDENDELISLLLNHDPDGYQVRERNIFGDLPVHVAASVGVKEETWKVLLHHILIVVHHETSKESMESKEVSGCDFYQINVPHSSIWSMNKAGFTPIHLMWMRQVHGNKIQYPLSTRHFGRIERRGIYYEALESAVGEIVTKLERKNVNSPNDEVHGIASLIMGPFWNSLVLYLQATWMCVSIHDCFPSKLLGCEGLEGKGFYFLHAACSLASPLLPSPVLDLAFALFPNQVHDLDENGRTPLHYACASYLTMGNEQFRLPTSNDGWKENDSEVPLHSERHSDLQELMSRNPTAVTIVDKNGLLPLNFAIENEKCWMKMTVRIDGFAEWCNQRAGGHCVLNCTKILQALIKADPDSLAWRNPRSLFLPFMQCAADSEGHSIESVYYLLRMSPGDVSSGFDNAYISHNQETDATIMELS